MGDQAGAKEHDFDFISILNTGVSPKLSLNYLGGSLTNLRLVCTCVFMRKEMGSAKFKSIQCIVLIMVFLVIVVLLLRYEWEQC